MKLAWTEDEVGYRESSGMTRSKSKGVNAWKSVQGQTEADWNGNKPGRQGEISLRKSAAEATG